MVDLMVNEQQPGTAVKGVSAGFKLTEVGVIPEDWGVTSISEIATIRIGKDVDERRISADLDNKYCYPVFSNTVDEPGIYGYYDYAEYVGNAVTVVGRGVGLGTAICRSGGFGAIGRLIVLFPKGNSIFLSNYINHAVDIFNESSGVPQLTGTALGQCKIAWPSLDEQTAIADTLSDVDILIFKLEKKIVKKQAIKTATMQQLLTGKTRLPQFSLRDDGAAKGYKKNELGEIPEDWDISTYGQVFSFLSTSTNARSDLSDTGEYGYIHYGDIHTKWNNNLNLENSSVPRISSDLVSSSFIEEGDLIMADASEDYAGIGKSIEIQGVRDNVIVAGLHTYLLRDVNNIFVDGFRGYLHCIRAVKANIDRLATGMKVFGVSKNNLKTIPIPVPPKEEQIAIAAILSDMDKEIQILQQRLDKTRQLKQGMMQELLTGKIRLIERN